MPLRPVSELGLTDATDVEPVVRDQRQPPRKRAPSERPRPAPRSKSGASSNGGAPAETQEQTPTAAPAHRPGVALADEPTTFLQIMVPGELHERLTDVSYALAVEHRKLRHQKTILGALIWRYVRPDDPESLCALSSTLDAYLATDLAEAPAEIKAGAHLPFSLKHSLDGAALALRRTRRDASAKTLLSALIWRHVEAPAPAPLVELLETYRELVRPALFRSSHDLPLRSTR